MGLLPNKGEGKSEDAGEGDLSAKCNFLVVHNMFTNLGTVRTSEQS